MSGQFDLDDLKAICLLCSCVRKSRAAPETLLAESLQMLPANTVFDLCCKVLLCAGGTIDQRQVVTSEMLGAAKLCVYALSKKLLPADTRICDHAAEPWMTLLTALASTLAVPTHLVNILQLHRYLAQSLPICRETTSMALLDVCTLGLPTCVAARLTADDTVVRTFVDENRRQVFIISTPKVVECVSDLATYLVKHCNVGVDDTVRVHYRHNK